LGKRSNFDRIPRDYYRTFDPKAVAALKPFLVKGMKFVEPCAGDGILTDQLIDLSLTCTAEYDIEPSNHRIVQLDALTLEEHDVTGSDVIITNPPWDRKLLHPMIERFAKLRPTWLLFDSNWANTRQSSRYVKDYCTDIVSIGRLCWIEGTTMSGKDDCSWYRLDVNKKGDCIFRGRQ